MENKENDGQSEMYKCGYCGTILNWDGLENHSCFEKRRPGELMSDENFSLTMVSTEAESPKEQNSDVDELLISLVQQRKPLYDHRLPTMERTKQKKESLWGEIFNSLNGILTIEDLKKRWKYLRDRYIKEKKIINNYKPSGSASNVNKKTTKFKYYELLQFLNDVLENNRTISNIEIEDSKLISGPSSSVSECSLLSPNEMDSNKPPAAKKRKRNDTAEAAPIEQAILDVLKQPERNYDEVDGFCTRLAASLRRLPVRKRAETEIKIMQLVYEVEYE